MSEAPQAGGLFPAGRESGLRGCCRRSCCGRRWCGGHEVMASEPIGEDQIQPASVDLRLGEVAYRVRASFLPGARASVAEKLQEWSMHRLDLTQGAVLEKDCVYIVPLLEHLALRRRMSAMANPKSSIGRLDVFARVITDQGTEFDRVREGYKGPLYAEISPLRSASWCAPDRGSCSCVSAAGRPCSATRRYGGCTRRRRWSRRRRRRMARAGQSGRRRHDPQRAAVHGRCVGHGRRLG